MPLRARWLALLYLTGCKGPMSTPHSLPDAAALRAEVTTALGSIGGAPRWLYDGDPAFDSCIAAALGQARGATLDAGEHAELVRGARYCVEHELTSAEGCARIMARMEARYLAPEISRAGADEVTVDVGVVPGPVSFTRGRLLVNATPRLDRWEWATAEVLQALRLALQQPPTAQRYRAVARVYTLRSGPLWTYTYEPGRHRIVVATEGRPGDIYVIETKDETFADVTSLHTLDHPRLSAP